MRKLILQLLIIIACCPAKSFAQPEGKTYKLTLITDGKHDKEFSTQYMVVDRSASVEVKLLRRGGFAASLQQL